MVKSLGSIHFNQNELYTNHMHPSIHLRDKDNPKNKIINIISRHQN